MSWSNLIDLELDDDDAMDVPAPGIARSVPQYPWGTRLTLTHVELKKMGLDIADCCVGDMVDMRAFGVVTSLSQDDGPMGPCCRVEIQIQKLAIENEMEEDDGPAPAKRRRPSYTKRAA